MSGALMNKVWDLFGMDQAEPEEYDDENVAEGETGKANLSIACVSVKLSLLKYRILLKIFIVKSFFGYLDRSSKSMSSNLFVSTSSWTAIVSPLRAALM